MIRGDYTAPLYYSLSHKDSFQKFPSILVAAGFNYQIDEVPSFLRTFPHEWIINFIKHFFWVYWNDIALQIYC